jgi:hypothetical protein
MSDQIKISVPTGAIVNDMTVQSRKAMLDKIAELEAKLAEFEKPKPKFKEGGQGEDNKQYALAK